MFNALSEDPDMEYAMVAGAEDDAACLRRKVTLYPAQVKPTLQTLKIPLLLQQVYS